ncbi:MAG: Cys-tRNA(Pro) deacylase [Ignavibacteria bacterium]|nr:Cys-tRNA(Pro) deacylase [Ignavibacteria bacterium]
MKKTNATRIIESKGIEYSLHEYEVDEDDLTGITVAKKIHAESDSVFKTLVARNDKNEIFIFCLPVTVELNLKKAAIAAGAKNIELIKLHELLPLTGYIRGGCSPVGMKKHFPTYFDETAQLFNSIYVSAGIRGAQIKINPFNLKDLVEGDWADLV